MEFYINFLLKILLSCEGKSGYFSVLYGNVVMQNVQTLNNWIIGKTVLFILIIIFQVQGLHENNSYCGIDD